MGEKLWYQELKIKKKKIIKYISLDNYEFAAFEIKETEKILKEIMRWMKEIESGMEE